MTSDEIHAPLRDDLPEGIDKAAFLADMEAIAEEAGDWRDHLPYEAVCNYNSDPQARIQYQEHVTGCRYCQELVAVFNRDPTPNTIHARPTSFGGNLFGFFRSTVRRLCGRR